MSVQAMAWALSISTGSVSRKVVLLSLANCHNGHTGKCCPKVSYIAAEADLSERTVKRALADLEAAGLICRDRTRNGNRQGVNHYRLAMDNVSFQGDRMAPVQGDTVAPQEPEEDLEPSEETYVSSANGTDSAQKTPLELLWDACEQHAQPAPESRSHRKAYAKLVREMLDAGWTPEMVAERAKAYRKSSLTGEWPLTLAALAKWGAVVARKPSQPVPAVVTDEVEVLPVEENARRARDLLASMNGAVQDMPE